MFGPLVVIRATQAVLIVGVVLVTRSAWRVDRRLIPATAGVGVLDMAAAGAFVLAVQTGALAVAAVLSSLYPVATVILATVFLRERVTRSHAVGIALAALAHRLHRRRLGLIGGVTGARSGTTVRARPQDGWSAAAGS